MRLTINTVVMQCGAEGSCDLSGSTREGDTVLAARNAVDRKPLLLEPRLHLRDIGVGDAKLLGELVRSEPLVIRRGRRVLLCRDESL